MRPPSGIMNLILDWTTWRAYSARRLFPSFVRIIISKVRCWKGLVRPYVILERKGVKVGVFGLGTQLRGWLPQRITRGVTYEDPVTAANRVADELKTRSIATLWYAFPIWGGISTVWTTRNWCRPRAISILCWAAIRILISSIPKC